MRTSSKRVINELHRGGINTIMLTGDAIDAALSVAGEVGLVKKHKVAILETKSGDGGEVELQWRIVKLSSSKGTSFRSKQGAAETQEVTLSSVKEILKRERQGDYSVAATGRALELALGEAEGKSRELLVKNLAKFSVIARATPALKKSVITSLKEKSRQKVMMCGELCKVMATVLIIDCPYLPFHLR